ncbi:Uncharacterized protein putative in bacteria [Rubellimicrobium thermophilum DSM 16684]|uniref:Uncharacterized protein putative in bacteria n=1 Tax=Rubellimicrobium thermophilum DSM 16684 TaxID=1123069 RepID=S9SC66_9RHOB|nr:Uncharacterized protein putative in bacteria [Rubellimicrobium thermophilum DSM 16684]
MHSRNKILDDLAQLMTNAMGVAQGAREEAQNALKGLVDRLLADRDLVTREEFEAVRAMAQKAREENDALAVRLAALEGRIAAAGQPGDGGQSAIGGAGPGDAGPEAESRTGGA